MFKNSVLARPARLASVLGLSAMLGVGVLAPAMAAPDPNPPIRSGNNRNQRGDVLRGTVDRVSNANSFDLRARDGRIYRVNMRVPLGLQKQSEVRVVGDLRGSTFDARLVTVGDFGNDRTDDGYGDYNDDGYNNGGDYNNGGNTNPPSNYQGQQVTLTGRITRLTSRTDFEVRDDDDGTIYRVRTDSALPYSIRQGDRIEARGELNGNTVRANSAIAVDDRSNGGDQNNGGSFVRFSGPILSIDLNREEARVRAGNGYTYTIRARRSQLDDFRVGQRVRVEGNWINERVETTLLTRE